MTTIHTATFRSFHQGVVVTISLRRDDTNFFVRVHPHGHPKNYDTACASAAEAESLYTQKFNVGMTGVA